MIELRRVADDLRQLLGASELCLWCGEPGAIAVPVASSPADWVTRPFILSDTAPTVVSSRSGKEALGLLPLHLRGQTTADSFQQVLQARRHLSAERTVGLLAAWRPGDRIPTDVSALVNIILAANGHVIWQAGPSGNLLESDPQMHALADALPQGIVLVPLDGRMGFCNGPAATLLGIAEGESAPEALSQALQAFVQRTINHEEVARFATYILGNPAAPAERRSVTGALPVGRRHCGLLFPRSVTGRYRHGHGCWTISAGKPCCRMNWPVASRNFASSIRPCAMRWCFTAWTDSRWSAIARC